jgi:hypothetical protein
MGVLGVIVGGHIVESKYSIDASERLVRLQVWGELRADGLIRLMAQIGADPRHRVDMCAIIDLREAHGDWDYSEIQRLRDYVARVAAPQFRPQQRRWAAIVSPGNLGAAAHVLIVISESVAEHIRMQLFEDGQTALKWVRAGQVARALDASVVTA